MKIITKSIAMFLIWVTVLTFTGCPKGEKTVRQLRTNSTQLSVYGAKLVTAFGDAFKAGEITREQLAALNVPTGAFTIGLGVYREAVAEAERVIKSGQTLPTGTIATLERILDDRVIATFFDVLAKVGALPLERSEVIKTIISSIRLTILALRGAFSRANELMEANSTFATA